MVLNATVSNSFESWVLSPAMAPGEEEISSPKNFFFFFFLKEGGRGGGGGDGDQVNHRKSRLRLETARHCSL